MAEPVTLPRFFSDRTDAFSVETAEHRPVRRYAFAGSVYEQDDAVETVELAAPKELFRRVPALRRAILMKSVLRAAPKLELSPCDLIPDAKEFIRLERSLTRSEHRALSRNAPVPLPLASLPDWEELLSRGLVGIAGELRVRFDLLPQKARQSADGEELLALFEAVSALRVLTDRLIGTVTDRIAHCDDSAYRSDLVRVEKSLLHIRDKAPRDFTDAVLFLWVVRLSAALSAQSPVTLPFGRLDALLAPYYRRSLDGGTPERFCSELLYRFLLHSAALNVGTPIPVTLSAPTAVFDPDEDALSDTLLSILLDPVFYGRIRPVIAVSDTPDTNRIPAILAHAASQGGAYLRFDSRAFAVFADSDAVKNALDPSKTAYAAVSGTVDALPGETVYDGACVPFLSVLELTLGGGKPFLSDHLSASRGVKQRFDSFDALYGAFRSRLRQCVRETAETFDRRLASSLAEPRNALLSALGLVSPAPSVLLTGTGFVPALHALLGIRDLVFERKVCTLSELIAVFSRDWADEALLLASARANTPQLFSDNADADTFAARVLRDFADAVSKAPLRSVRGTFRASLSDAAIDAGPFRAFTAEHTAAPSAAAYSLGTILGGYDAHGAPGNVLTGGYLQTLSLPRILRCDPSYRAAVADFLSGYAALGGASLRLTLLDAEGTVKNA